MSRLAPERDPNLLVGADTFDDAGVYRIAPDLALVQTLDFFPPLVDDPYDFGRIAAANSLSDIYAMGGRPITAMNIVGFPDRDLESDVLAEILRGGADIVHDAGAVVVGGHSVRDLEVKYGLSVTGLVDPAHMLTNAAARPGDVLVLTKPLGSGVLTTACKSGKFAAQELQACIQVMTTLNRAAAEAAQAVGARACTDITGFGLLGHAGTMAEASSVSVEFDSRAVPLMQHALRLAREGVLTRAHRTTREHLADRLEIDSAVEPALVGALLDAQTSGGLLISVAADRASALIHECSRRKTPVAAIVGRVTAEPGAAVVLK